MNSLKPENTINYHQENEPDIKHIFKILLSARKVIILVTILFAVLSVIFSLWQVNHYKSETILKVTNESGSSSLMNRFGGLASFAGLNMPVDGENKAALVMETIKSRHFLNHLITFEGVLPSLMAADYFNKDDMILYFDKSVYEVNSDSWVREVEPPLKSKPSYLEAHEAYLGMLTATQDLDSGFINLSFEHKSPIFAKEILDLIVNEVNNIMREKDLKESADALNYLKGEIPKTSLVEIKNSINELIETQLETQMLAKVNENYMLNIIEPSFVPEKKSKPNRALICILGTCFGSLIIILWVLIRHYFLEEDNLDQN